MSLPRLNSRMKFATVVALAMSVASVSTRAGDVERVLQIDGFMKMSDVMRLYLDARAVGRDGAVTQTELGAHLDITLMPVLRSNLRAADWERDRYLWARVGYEAFAGHGEGNKNFTEKRLLTELTAQAPLLRSSGIWLICRLRVDFRDLQGMYSRRYRYRMGIQREFARASGRSLVPYIQAEMLYDTRYNAWNRRIYQVGVEVKMASGWRFEPYVSRQRDDRSSAGNVDRIGLRLKVYW